MVWPTVAVVTTNLDAGTDSPAAARANILDAVSKQNQMMAHVSTFGASLLDDASAAAARTTLGAAASGANTDITSVGAITGVTASAGNNSTLLATTAFVTTNAQQPGEVCFFARNTAPSGFLKANGALISRSVYAGLFAAIGTTFGVGDGSTTFAVPDMRGEFARGWDDARGVDSGRAFGSAQGSENLSHTHTGSSDTAPDHAHNSARQGGGVGTNIVTTTVGASINNFPTTGAGAHTHTLTINAAGATESRPRSIALLACIKF